MREETNIGSTENISPFEEMTKWYNAQCNGVWEHSYGIELTTTDNPGWRLEVDFKDTNLEGIHYDNLEFMKENEKTWYTFSVRNNVFVASSGPLSLLKIVEQFILIVREKSER